MSIPNYLGVAHAGLVGGLKNHAATATKFKRFVSHLDKPGLQRAISPGDLSALEVVPSSVRSGWEVNREAGLYYVFRFRMFTAGHSSLTGEDLYSRVQVALYQQIDPSWRVQPAGDASITEGFLEDNGAAVTVWEWQQAIKYGQIDWKRLQA